MRAIKITIILTLLTIETIACTCNERINKRRLIKNSDFAFIGVVTENVYNGEFEESYRKERGIQNDAKVKLVKQIKGTSTVDNVVIVISSASGECDVNLIPGKKYLIVGNYKQREAEDTFDPSLLPPDSLIQMDSTVLKDMGTTQPNGKTRDEWLKELGQSNKLIFTTVCMTFYIKED